MSRFNTVGQTNKRHSAIQTTGERTTTHEGGVGFKRDQKSDLYLMAVSFMGGDSNFYESSDQRYDRLISLARAIAVEDPEWMGYFIHWLRNGAMMRTAAGVVAVEAVKARLSAAKVSGERILTSQGTINRRFIDAACARADEPGEILAYYLTKYGKPLPYSLKKGIGDAVTRLYTERGYLRYAANTTSSVGMADVIRLCRPKPSDEKQSHLFNYITEWEHRGSSAPSTLAELEHLPKVATRRQLMDLAPEYRVIRDVSALDLRNAEMGWENISSWLGKMDKAAWEAVIPNMGVMALLRNLRNFDEIGITDSFAQEHIMPKLSDLEEIKKARVLPMRFLSAYRAAPSVRWSYPLELGLNACLSNVPEIPGRTLVLIDMSASMTWGSIGGRSKLSYADAAKIFGSVMAARNPGVELIQYGSFHELVDFRRGTSVLKIMEKFQDMGGTNTGETLRATYNGHDRVIIVTDEQAHYSGYGAVGEDLPNGVPLYTWNLAGYSASHAPSGQDNRYIFGGGFSDAAFGMIKYIEDGRKATWPWDADVSA